jgi:hypothetical protein
VSFILRAAVCGGPKVSVPDTDAPTLVSATIPAAGTSISIAFNESVSVGAGGNGGFVLDTSGAAVTLTYSSGAGTSTLVYTLNRTVVSGETILDFDYTQPGNGVEDAAGNDLASFSNQQALVTNNSTQVGGDVTAPNLSSPTAVGGTTTGTGTLTVSTDEDNGTLYWVVTTSSTSPTAAQVKAGQDDLGATASDSGSSAVSGTGVQTLTDAATGLAGDFPYYAHFMHEDAATNQSTVVSTATPFDSQWAIVEMLLLNEEGAHGTGTFTDQSSNGATVSKSGTPTWSNTTTPGAAWDTAMVCNAQNINVPDGIELGAGDFCLEMWARNAGATGTIVAKTNAAGTVLSWEVLFVNAGIIGLYVSSNGTSNNMINGGSLKATWSTNTWYHIVISRSGNTWNGYVDGTRNYNATVAGTIANTASVISVGGRDTTAGLSLNGRVASVRLTVGAPRYTGASLTVPTAPYPTA